MMSKQANGRDLAVEQLIEYILDTESENFYDWVLECIDDDFDGDFDRFKQEWTNVQHIFVSALIAAGIKPDFKYIHAKVVVSE